MSLKDDLIRQALSMIIDTKNFKLEDVSVNVTEYDDGLKRLSVDIDYNDDEHYKFKPPKRNYTSPYSRKSRKTK